jgi:hypothetical protein
MHVLILLAVVWFIGWRIQAARQARANLAAQLAILAELEAIERKLDGEE